MPSERMRRKDDTWTSEELNKALKGSKADMLRRRRDDEGSRRRRSDDVDGLDHRRDQDRRSHHREEDDNKVRRTKHRGDSPDQVDLTEEDRERLREERRVRREGGKEHTKYRLEENKSRSKENRPTMVTNDDEVGKRQRDKEDDRHSEKRHNRSEESKKHAQEKGERRKHLESGDQERRHHEDVTYTDTTKGHHKQDSSVSQRYRDSSNQSRRHEEKKDRQKIISEETRHHPRKEKDDEEEREKRRQERRERREQENSKDKDREKGHRSHRRNEKSEKDQGGSNRRKEIDSDRKRYHSRDRYSDKDQSHERKRESRHLEEELKPEKWTSGHREVGRESEKSNRQHNEKSAIVSSPPVGQIKTEHQNMGSDDNDDYQYEEDFEDYEDDFEEDERILAKQETEMEGVLRALDEENNKLAMASRRSNRSDSPDPSVEHFRRYDPVHQDIQRPRKSVINFGSAKQRVVNQAMSGKARKRFDDLSRLIELDVVSYDIFDLQPVKEYEMYIRSFGRSDTTQAYVQTGDDDMDREIQTEEIETLSKWTQHPPDDETAVGGEGINVQASEHKQEGSSKIDTNSLNQFLDRVGRIIFTILDEEYRCDTEEAREQGRQPAVSFCSSVSHLGRPNFLNGRQVIALSFCQSEPDYLLTLHATPVNDLENVQPRPLHSIAVICVWNLSQPTYPYRICGSYMRVMCACFSPTKASLVFAGMHDGSVALWDLREPSSSHRIMTVDGQDHLVRFPTYNTAGVLELENHHSPVVSIVPVYSSVVGSQKDAELAESSSGLSFQLASMEEKAVVNLWVVAEVAVSDPAGSETDLGLSPGGKMKLLRSSSILLSNPNKYQSTTMELRALNLHLDPGDLNHFYVGTDTGHIVHGVQFGKRMFPLSYCSLSDSPVPIVSLDLSPFGQAYFLAGCEDGTLHLFNTKLENPIATWRGFISGDKIISVHWSHSRSAVFFVLDNNSTVFTFDLVESGLGPIKTDKITTASVTSMLLGGDPNLVNPGTSRPAFLVLALNNGTTDILTVSDEMRIQLPLEEEFMNSYVDRY